MNNLRKFTTEADYSAATLNYPAVSWVTATDNVYFDKSAPTPTFSGLTVYYNISDISQPTPLFKGGGGSGSGSGSGGVLPSAMIIDGTAVEVTNTYQFSTTGEHIVQYSFADNQIPKSFLANFTSGLVTKAVIGDAITSIGIYAFYYCNFTSCTIGNGVTSIGLSAFENCSSLTSCTIGAGVTSIDGQAFYNCSGLTSIVIPDSVTTIGMSAFQSCSGLTTVTIGSGVTEIGTWAFGNCTSLTSIVSNRITAPTIQSYTFNSIKTGGTLTVPSGSSGYDVWMGTGDYYLGKYNWTKVEQ